MLSVKEKNNLLITNLIAIIISLVVSIPFHQNKVTSFEIIVKFIIAPVIIFILALINVFTKHENYRPGNKYLMLTTYAPITSYIVAALFSGLLVQMRTTAGYSDFGSGWVLTTIILSSVLVITVAIAHVLNRWLIVFTKNESMIIDLFIFIAFISVTIAVYSLMKKHQPLMFESGSILYVLAPLLFGLLFGLFHVFRLIYLKALDLEYKHYSKRTLLSNWITTREEIYNMAEVDILYNLYHYAKEELGITDEFDEMMEEIKEELNEIISEPVEEPVVTESKPLEPTIVKKVVEIVNQVELNQIEQELQLLEAEKIQLENERALAQTELNRLIKENKKVEDKKADLEVIIKPVKPVETDTKTFLPTFENLVNYVRSIPGVVEKANQTKTKYRFYVNNKQFLDLSDAKNDYRITFLYDLEDIVNLIVYTPSVVKAKSPVGPHWFKLTNKGEYSEEQIYDIIDKSHQMLNIIEERKRAEKEQARLAKLEAKERAKAIELQKKLDEMNPEERRKEEEKALKKQASKKVQTEIAQSSTEKEQEREAARLKAQKEKEAAKLKTQKEKEKEAAKLKAQKEKEAAKLKAQKEKEKEAAKLKAQKEREAAKLKAQKEKEKEAAKLKAQKEKEKEAAKLKAQKEKEKEAAKLKAQKEKEKEAAKLKAQKEKEATQSKPREDKEVA